jgi:hypothetical protein
MWLSLHLALTVHLESVFMVMEIRSFLSIGRLTLWNAFYGALGVLILAWVLSHFGLSGTGRKMRLGGAGK